VSEIVDRSIVMAGLVPAIPIFGTQCQLDRDHRDIRAFTPVFDGLCPVMMVETTSQTYSFVLAA
jgi:hypothetical protein